MPPKLAGSGRFIEINLNQNKAGDADAMLATTLAWKSEMLVGLLEQLSCPVDKLKLFKNRASPRGHGRTLWYVEKFPTCSKVPRRAVPNDGTLTSRFSQHAFGDDAACVLAEYLRKNRYALHELHPLPLP